MKRILRLVIFALIFFIISKISTFGWHLSSNPFMNLTKNSQSAQRLKSHVYKLAHEIGDRSIFRHERLAKAAGYITQTFTSLGYTVEFQNYSVSERKVKNIIVTKLGVKTPEEIVIVGAHYDTCFNPGADDNASGVAGLLELARFMSDKQTNRSIKFIAFVNEEPPFFKTENMGSRVYAKAAKAKGENIKGVIILESIGYYSDKPHSQRYPPFFGLFYPNKGNFIAVVGNLPSRWIVKKVVSNFKKETRFPIESITTFGFIPGVDFSDHWSFWKEGYPAVMITNTAFYRNPDYHNSSDTYEKLDYESMSEVTKGLGTVLIEFTNFK